jgi:two-component system chemotaxis response regulator CheY
MPGPAANSSNAKTAGLSPAAAALLASMEHWAKIRAQAMSRRSMGKRKFERLPYTGSHVRITLTQPNGTRSDFVVVTSDLSAGGISVVHAGFVHKNTPVELHLTDLMARPRVLKGAVVWCVFLGGRAHALGVKFATPIDPRQFIEATAVSKAMNAGGEDDVKVSGRVMIVDDEELDRELLSMHLAEMNITTVACESIEAALKQFDKAPIDVAITDLNIGAERGEEVITSLRSRGYSGPILVVSSETDKSRIDNLLASGATQVFAKPYRPPELLKVVSKLLAAIPMPASDAPIYSQLEGVLSQPGPVIKFINTARKRSEELKKAMDEDNLETVRTLLKTFQATGAGYGFEIVTDAARLALKQIDASGAIAESKDSLRRLQMILTRMKMRPSAGDDD